MRQITEVTRRDIFALFLHGLDIEEFLEIKRIHYEYYGKLSEINFLKRIYDLKALPSCDSRFDDAEGDIWQHTINNDDYEKEWIFEDERLGLLNGEDEVLLKFLCAVFHPAVRNENGYWKEFLKEVNGLLRADGYELYPESKLSGRDVFGWRKYDPEANASFIPFSQRNKKEIKARHIQLSLKMNLREQIYNLLEKHSVVYRETTETGLDYNITTNECVFRDIAQFYQPKCYDEAGNYVETSDMQQFVLKNSPFYVLDAIEFFEKYNVDNDFASQINTLFNLHGVSYRLEQGQFHSIPNSTPLASNAAALQEKFTSEYLSKQIELMLRMQTENPTDAIGKAKELIESCCKTILENEKITWDKNWDMGNLTRETLKHLKLTPEAISDTDPVSENIKAVLGNLRGITTKLAEIRNPYGSGHGKSASFTGLETRHAKLAVGCSITFVTFLWDTYEGGMSK